MPVGAMIGSAAAGLGGAALSANASKSAAKTQSAAADRAAELQNQQFEKMLALQMPGYNRGEQAASVYMQALGIPSMTGQPATYQTQPGSSVVGNTGFGGGGTAGAPYRPMMAGRYSYQHEMLDPYDDGYSPEVGTAQHGVATQTPTTAPLSIADQVMQTPGYQTQLDQGLKSIDRAAPLTGGMYSGRRMKALNDYGQNTFGSYYDNWLNRVGGVAGQGQQVAQNVGQAGMQNAQNVGGLMVQGANAKAQGSLNSAAAWTNAMNTGLGMVGGAKGWF